MKKINAMSKAQKGFTLLEIIIVLAIIGTVMAIVARSIGGKSEEAKISMASIGVSNIKSNVSTYSLKKRKLPESLDELGLEKDDLTDPWGNNYQYRKPGKNGSYDVYSFGADGKEGGEGNDADIYK